MKEKQIIGRDSYADFPAFGLEKVPVKVDSGAYTSTIHCCSIELNKEDLLEVVFLDKKFSAYTGKKIVFEEYETRKVRSSSGQSQRRFTVKGTISIEEKSYKTSFTLSKRDKMKYPVLLGRRLLNKKFLIDPSLTEVKFSKKSKKQENA